MSLESDINDALALAVEQKAQIDRLTAEVAQERRLHNAALNTIVKEVHATADLRAKLDAARAAFAIFWDHLHCEECEECHLCDEGWRELGVLRQSLTTLSEHVFRTPP